MIEVQIKNNITFKELQPYAIYSSELTGVCTFNDNMSSRLKELGVLDDNYEKEKAQEQIIRVTKSGVMRIDNPSLEILSFLGNRSPADHDIAVSQFQYIRALIYARIITPDDSFKKFFTFMNEDSDPSMLQFSNKRYHKHASLMTLLQEEYPDKKKFKISDITMFKDEFVNIKPLAYKDYELTVEEPITKIPDKYQYVAKARDKFGKDFILTYYIRPSDINKIIFSKGNKITIAASTERSYGTMRYLSNPIVLPKGFKLATMNYYKPTKRKMRMEYWSLLYHQYKYRSELTEDGEPTYRIKAKSKFASEGVFE